MIITWADARDALLIAAGLVWGGRKVIESIYPLIRPALTAARDRIIRDIRVRLDRVERDVEVIKAVQSHTKDGE